MNRIALTVDQDAMITATGHLHPINRFVVRSEKIVGLVETIEGDVALTIQTAENRPAVRIFIKESFDYVARFMCK